MELLRPIRRRGFVLFATILGLTGIAACQGGDTASDSPSQCGGQSMDVEDRDYCVYDQSAITETGFQCPQQFPNRSETGNLVVCSKDDQSVPDGHEREIERRHEETRGEQEGNRGGDWTVPNDGGVSCDAVCVPCCEPETGERLGCARCVGPEERTCPGRGTMSACGRGGADVPSRDDARSNACPELSEPEGGDVSAPTVDTGPALPVPTISLRPEDGRTATRSTSSPPRIIFRWYENWAERNGGITRQTLRKVADNVTIQTWPEFEKISATTTIGSIPDSGQRREVSIEVNPDSRLRDRWYALQVSGAPVAVDWDREVPTLSNGMRGVRFHPTSNPRLRAVRTCEKRDGTKLIIRFSEPIQGRNRSVTDAIVLSQQERTLDRRERSTDRGMTAVPRRFSRGRPVTVDIMSGLESTSGVAVEPTTYTFTPKCESGCTIWRAPLR